MAVALPSIAELALRLQNFNAIARVCAAISDGKLQKTATAAIRTTLSEGVPEVDSALRDLIKVWVTQFQGLDSVAMATVLNSAAEAISLERKRSPRTQVVWTGPGIEGSYLRATREVLREIVRGARHSLVVVGYWIASPGDGEGIIQELIDLFAEAVGRGVKLTFILDERTRGDGTDNRKILKQIWPDDATFPRLLTWRLPSADRHLKLHAKVLVADDEDALVTSANLTWYAMDRNMEMGVRIIGQPAGIIAHHLKLLDQQGVLQSF
jgi:cardiolipin synthase A/B